MLAKHLHQPEDEIEHNEVITAHQQHLAGTQDITNHPSNLDSVLVMRRNCEWTWEADCCA